MPKKKIVSAVFLTLLVGCSNSYPSAEEAKVACNKWMSEATRNVKVESSLHTETIKEMKEINDHIVSLGGAAVELPEVPIVELPLRVCYAETESKQFLGKEYEGSFKTEVISQDAYDLALTQFGVIKKYFKY